MEAEPSWEKTWFDRLLDAASRLALVIAGTSLVILTVIFGWLVFGRYVLNATPTWVEQVSLLLILVITFLGAAIGIHENTHLGVSFFREVSPPPVRRLFTLVSHIILAVFGAVMLVQSWKLMVFKWGSEIPLIHVPEGLRALPITICGGLVLAFSIGHLVLMLRGVDEEQSLTE
ncbi:MAG TPA: TRAP transporter small permease [Afifellaceae bacterium]|nr:TRAP transporter small permease [Afifellaceae bacterium]